MLDSIYHMTNTMKSHFWRINVIILSFNDATLLWTSVILFGILGSYLFLHIWENILLKLGK